MLVLLIWYMAHLIAHYRLSTVLLFFWQYQRHSRRLCISSSRMSQAAILDLSTRVEVLMSASPDSISSYNQSGKVISWITVIDDQVLVNIKIHGVEFPTCYHTGVHDVVLFLRKKSLEIISTSHILSIFHVSLFMSLRHCYT